VIIEKYISTRCCSTCENIISLITREPKIGILPKPTKYPLYILVKEFGCRETVTFHVWVMFFK